MMATTAAASGILHFVRLQQGLVDQIELTVGSQARPGEVAAADDADEGVKQAGQHQSACLCRRRPDNIWRGETCGDPFSAGRMAQIETHLDIVAAQETDQVFDQPLGRFAQGSAFSSPRR